MFCENCEKLDYIGMTCKKYNIGLRKESLTDAHTMLDEDCFYKCESCLDEEVELGSDIKMSKSNIDWSTKAPTVKELKDYTVEELALELEKRKHNIPELVDKINESIKTLKHLGKKIHYNNDEDSTLDRVEIDGSNDLVYFDEE